MLQVHIGCQMTDQSLKKKVKESITDFSTAVQFEGLCRKSCIVFIMSTRELWTHKTLLTTIGPVENATTPCF